MEKRKVIGEIKVLKEHKGKTVLELMRSELMLANRQIRRVISTRGIRLNGRSVHSEQRVREGDLIRVDLPEAEQVKVEPVCMELNVVFEDSSLLVLDKPPGINIHNTRPGETPALANGVAHYFRARGEIITPRPVHRLDRDASGIVVFAKSAEAQTVLTQRWDTDATQKLYWVLVEGPVETRMTIDAPILGKPALTLVEPLAIYRDVTELRVQIRTGRTNQIRVHLASIGHPVVGDRKNPSSISSRRLALHAESLELLHPKTMEKVRFLSPAPREAFRRIIDAGLGITRR